MQSGDRIYAVLTTLFSVLIVLGNLVYKKFIGVDLGIYNFEISVGVILYPLTFLITDLITEFYGKSGAIFCVRLGLAINIMVAIIINALTSTTAVSWSIVGDDTFRLVFGSYGISFASSLVACYISQMLDIRVYLWIKKLTNNKYLWMRNNMSAWISLLIDTIVVIMFLTAFGILPQDKMLDVIGNSYMFKLLVTLCCTPVFYTCVAVIRWLR